MSQIEIVSAHQQLCDEIHRCALEENRFLRQHQRTPEPALLDRKRDLLARLDASLTALRELPAASARDPRIREQLEFTRARILQVLQLDKENEQLLLRCSLGAPRPPAPPAGSGSLLQRIYSRCS